MLAYFIVGARAKEIMDTPGCRLQIHWRNFWNACGEPARYAWMQSEQVAGKKKGTGANRTIAPGKRMNRRRGRRE